MKALCLFLLLSCTPVFPAVFGSLRGVVHDPDHRPVAGAKVLVKSATSDFSRPLVTISDGSFEATALPAGDYVVSVSHDGFAPASQSVVVSSGSAPILHFQLQLGTRTETVNVTESALAVNPEQMTPEVIVSRAQIEAAPGAVLSNSLSMITDFVPGSWVTHDQLHIRGGHQVTWAIDGVPIPNTNIASNVGPQIDPKDADYVEAQRGGYSAAYGDRSYGIMNVVPRTGFERSNEGEIFATGGSFGQTNDQINFGNHTQRLAYFASVDGNRSDYGLETPGPPVLHDRVWGLGGMGTFLYNSGSNDQFRLVSTLRRDDYQVPNDPDAQAANVRDVERERDALAAFSWEHTFQPGLSFTLSPFYHYNLANYDGGPNDDPITATQHRTSQYAGFQTSVSEVTKRHNFSAGIYQFGQWDTESIALVTHDQSVAPLAESRNSQGNLEAAFAQDDFKPFSWLTLSAGVRLTHFSGAISENAADPRLGGSIRIPHLNWTLRGFWGRYYQAPPLSTVAGPLLDFAATQGLSFIPLRGERDQEHQFGIAIPVHGWSIDVNNYNQRARNYFDHNSIGSSNVFFPLTIDGARLRGWEVSLRSPRIARRAEIYLTYAHAHAEGQGAVSGGLTDFSPPSSGYFLLDHDQLDTLHTGFRASLPAAISASADVHYGSGFTDGSSDTPAHLPGHITCDFALTKPVTEHITLGVTALNAANRRFLLDNSETFGGTHYADPRQIYVQIRYRFRL